ADRVSRRLLVLGCDMSLAIVQVTVGMLLITGYGSIWLLLVASILYGVANALLTPALTGLVTQTIAKEKLQQANALIGISTSTAYIVGPAIAGLLIAASSPALTYLLDAATFVVSAVTLTKLRIAPVARSDKGNFFRDIVTGWREVTSRPWYWIGMCCHAVWNL